MFRILQEYDNFWNGTERRNYCRVLGNFVDKFRCTSARCAPLSVLHVPAPIPGSAILGVKVRVRLGFGVNPSGPPEWRNGIVLHGPLNLTIKNNVDYLTSSRNSHFYYSLTKAKQSEIRRIRYSNNEIQLVYICQSSSINQVYYFSSTLK